MTNKLFFFKGLLRFVNLVSTLSRLDPALAMHIVKYEELRYVVAEHTADESLRLVLVDTERTGHTYQRRSLHASHLCKTTKKVPPAALPPLPPSALPLRPAPCAPVPPHCCRATRTVSSVGTLLLFFVGSLFFFTREWFLGARGEAGEDEYRKNLFITHT